MNTYGHIAIIGCGNMGSAIARGLIENGLFQPQQITVTARTSATLDKIGRTMPGIDVTTDNSEAAERSDLIIIAVKPWQAEDVLKGLSKCKGIAGKLVVSAVAGLETERIRKIFKEGKSPTIARAIPNTAALTGKSVTFISPDSLPGNIERRLYEIFSSIGEVKFVDEAMLDAGMALASCGIAYALRYIEAAISGGMQLGFTKEDARDIVTGTVEGAVALLKNNSSFPEEEIRKVTTPGGYTECGLRKMEELGFSGSVTGGLMASAGKEE